MLDLDATVAEMRAQWRAAHPDGYPRTCATDATMTADVWMGIILGSLVGLAVLQLNRFYILRAFSQLIAIFGAEWTRCCVPFRQRWRRRRGGGGFSARTSDRSPNVARRRRMSDAKAMGGRLARAGPEAKQSVRGQNLRHAVGRVALHLSETFGFQRSHALGEAPPRSSTT